MSLSSDVGSPPLSLDTSTHSDLKGQPKVSSSKGMKSGHFYYKTISYIV